MLSPNFISLFTGQSFGSAIVTDLSPRRIGYGGGAVTINGEGFSEDVFNQFDPVLGNKVINKRLFVFLAVNVFNYRSGLPMNLCQCLARHQ